MLKRHQSRLVGLAILLVVAVTTVSCSDQFAPDPAVRNPALAEVEVQAPIIFVGAGDVASCTRDGDSQTAALIEPILNANPTAWAFIAGDNVYEDGTTEEYRDCYDPTWGRFKTRTKPSLGNHEYDGPELAEPLFNYFGNELWQGSRARGGYYSFDLGTSWHVVVLNSNPDFVPTIAGSPQDEWLKADLAANNKPCLAAVWHHPRFYSSQDVNSSLSRSTVKPFWDRLYAKGADLVLNGHSHNYERFAPQKPDGTLDAANGIRQFIVGMGGKGTGAVTKFHPNSLVREGTTLGVMQLTLKATGYDWKFIPVAGKTFSDEGSSTCHGASGGGQTNDPPVASFFPTCSGLNCTFNSSASSDGDGMIASRHWDFGDGLTSDDPNPTITHGYAQANPYQVTFTVTDDEGATNSTSQTVQVGTSPVTGGAVFVGAGDIAHCSLASDEATAKLIDALPSATVFTLGDNASSTGSATEFSNCYGPTWGRHKTRTRPAVGYMDYKTTNASGYFGYFGAAAGNPAEGYYSYNLGDWHIIALNSKVPMSAGSAQESWLRADLAANPKVCTLAYIARARFSSGQNGNATSVQPLWQALYDRGADIILAGSDHTYERFARQTPAGAAAPSNGIQQFVVGTGGQSLTGLLTRQPNSVVFNGSTFGVLKLTLGSRGYSWEFVPVAGSTFTDAGSMDCVGAPAQTPNVAPTASFSEDCTAGLSCAFTDLSTDNDGTIKTRSWEFGDGATSTAANPTHLYAANGTYTVKLTVTDDDDAPSAPAATRTFTVTNKPPSAGFVWTCTDLDCDFENASEDADGTIRSWEWDFGDGTLLEGDFPSPSHHYASAGPHTVTLSVEDDHDAKSATFSRQVTVSEPAPNQAPTAAFAPPSCSATVACSFDDQSTDDRGIATRKWDFGDGTIVNNASDPTPHTYATAALYHVTLTAKDADGLENSITHDVTVGAPPPPNTAPVADFTAPSCTVNTACSFDDQSTDDSGIANRKWDFGDGTIVENAPDPASHTYTTATLRQVTLTVRDADGLENSITHDVTVSAPPPPENQAPVAAFNLSCNNLVCTFTDQSTDSDGIKTWSWAFGDGGTSTLRNPPPHTYTSGGSKTVTLTVIDNRDKPSAAPATQTFTVAANVAPTAAFTSSCSGLTCSFSNGSSDGDGTIAARSWNFGDGATSTSNSPSRTYAAAGTYTVRLTVTDDDGATGTTTRSVTVTAPTTNRIPTALFGSSCTRLVCKFTDRSTDPDGNGTIVAWSWSFGDGATSTARHPSRTYRAGGTYKVKLTVTDNRGASDPITHTITVTP